MWTRLRQLRRATLIRLGFALSLLSALLVAGLRDPVEGMILLTGSLALVLGLANRPIAPVLGIAWLGEAKVVTEPTIGADVVARPIASDEIVEEQLDAAWSTIPAPPPPSLLPGASASQRLLGAVGAMAQTGALFVTDESREEFAREIDQYEAELRRWLVALERERDEQQRVFIGAIRISESGGGAADHLRARLRFPPGFDPPQEASDVGDPPKRPHYEPPLRIAPLVSVGDLARAPSIMPPPWERTAITYVPNPDGGVTIEIPLGHINAGDYRDSSPFYLRAGRPGQYQVEWEISGSALRRPLKGRLAVAVAEPASEESLISLRQAEAECERWRL